MNIFIFAVPSVGTVCCICADKRQINMTWTKSIWTSEEYTVLLEKPPLFWADSSSDKILERGCSQVWPLMLGDKDRTHCWCSSSVKCAGWVEVVALCRPFRFFLCNPFLYRSLCTGAEIDIVARQLYSSNSFVDFARKKAQIKMGLNLYQYKTDHKCSVETELKNGLN